jgi:hypothetical protein
MRISLIIAFTVFVVSLLVSVAIGLLLIWNGTSAPSAEYEFRLMSSSVIITLAALLYIAAGDAMIRILASNRNT